MIEIIFVLSIILVLGSITLYYGINNQPRINIDKQANLVVSLIEEAKSKAGIFHKQINLDIESNSISYSYEDSIRTINLAKDFYFSDIKEIYFNEAGNANMGNHINLCNESTCKSIIVNVGSGAIRVE